MGRSRESLKRKRSSGSKDSGYHTKRRFSRESSHPDSARDDKSYQSTAGTSLQSFFDVITYNQVPFYSWLTYFLNEEYKENSSTVAKIVAFIEFFENHPPMAYNVESGFNLDVNLCIDDSALRRKWPNFIEDMKMNPQHTLKCINAAFFEVIIRRSMKEDRGDNERVFRTLQTTRMNLLNYERIDPVSCVELSSHGRLISTSGTIIALGLAKLSVDSIVFACECKRQVLSKPQNDPVSMPKKCDVCGNARFKRSFDSPYESMKICQSIWIKGHGKTDQTFETGAILPKVFSVRLTANLVDKFMIGDKIRIIGIPRLILGDCKPSTTRSNRLYIDAKSVFEDDDFSSGNSEIDPRVIERIKSEPDILNLLVHSLCPSVQGHEMIKAALVLSLFAGTHENDEIRDNIHILIVGNLGLGKSQLLRACAQVAPQGTYIRGNETVSLSSTMTAVRENCKEDYRFEAGALALANSGILCLDEFDKMSSQHQIIYNAMLRRQIYTTNAELKENLPFRASIFAMTNSTKKCYDSSKSVLENVNTNKGLLDQFNLIFLMSDDTDKYLDELMRDRVLKERGKRAPFTQQAESSTRRIIEDPRIDAARYLREKLVSSISSGPSDLLPAKFFQMYINYTRLYVKPILSNASKNIIKRFCSSRYQKIKKSRESEKNLIPTLVILTEARAKIDSRGETNAQDAFDAIEIIEHSMAIDMKNFTGLLSNNNTNKLTANKVKLFLTDLNREAVRQNKNTFTVEELQDITGQENITNLTFSTLLSKLNDQGYLFKVSSDLYKLVFQ